MEANILNWLLDQAPVIVVMGIGIVVFYKLFIAEKKRSDLLSVDVIKIATAWEVKAEDLGKSGSGDRKEILKLLHEIKGIVSK